MHATVAPFLHCFLFSYRLWECFHLGRHPLHLLSAPVIMETKPLSLKKSTEYSLFFVIKFALTSKPAAFGKTRSCGNLRKALMYGEWGKKAEEMCGVFKRL